LKDVIRRNCLSIYITCSLTFNFWRQREKNLFSLMTKSALQEAMFYDATCVQVLVEKILLKVIMILKVYYFYTCGIATASSGLAAAGAFEDFLADLDDFLAALDDLREDLPPTIETKVSLDS